MSTVTWLDIRNNGVLSGSYLVKFVQVVARPTQNFHDFVRMDGARQTFSSDLSEFAYTTGERTKYSLQISKQLSNYSSKCTPPSRFLDILVRMVNLNLAFWALRPIFVRIRNQGSLANVNSQSPTVSHLQWITWTTYDNRVNRNFSKWLGRTKHLFSF